MHILDVEMNQEIAIEVSIMDTGQKMTIMADGRVEGLNYLLDVAYARPRSQSQFAVVSYIPDLLKRLGYRRKESAVELGFGLAACENGGWVLAEYKTGTDTYTRYACVDDEALYAQMRAWTERSIAEHRRFRALRTEIDAGPHLTAAREVS